MAADAAVSPDVALENQALELAMEGADDVPEFFAAMKKKGAYRQWVAEHQWEVDWEDDDYEPKLFSHLALDCLMELIIFAVIEFEKNCLLGSTTKEKDPYVLTKKRVERFRREMKAS